MTSAGLYVRGCPAPPRFASSPRGRPRGLLLRAAALRAAVVRASLTRFHVAVRTPWPMGRILVDELELVSRQLDRPLLIRAGPVRERAALDVHGEHLVRVARVVGPEVGDAARDRGLVLLRRPGGAVVGSELGQVGSRDDDRDRLLLVNTTVPFASAPNGSDFLPSWSRTFEASVHPPTSCFSSALLF